MFKHILNATDSSEPAVRAADYAVELATKLGASLTLVKPRFPECDALLRPGSAGRGIVEAAEDMNADLVVLGTHGRSWFGAPLGGAASRVIRLAPVPVLTVSPRDSEARDRSAVAAHGLADDPKNAGLRT